MWTAALLLGAAVLGETPEPAEAPAVVVVATSGGVRAIAVSTTRGYPALPTDELSTLLPVSARVEADDWATVEFAGRAFRFC